MSFSASPNPSVSKHPSMNNDKDPQETNHVAMDCRDPNCGMCSERHHPQEPEKPDGTRDMGEVLDSQDAEKEWEARKRVGEVPFEKPKWEEWRAKFRAKFGRFYYSEMSEWTGRNQRQSIQN